jgi:hypothetical protein
VFGEAAKAVNAFNNIPLTLLEPNVAECRSVPQFSSCGGENGIV